MTDKELIHACAEKVMGWTRQEFQQHDTEYAPSGIGGYAVVTGCWNPLNSDADAFMLVDKIISEGGYVELVPTIHHRWRILASLGYDWSSGKSLGVHHEALTPEGRRRAIVFATLKAHGFKEVEFLGIEQVGLYGTHGA